MAGYELLDHPADLRLRLRGDTPEAIFALAARALFEQLIENLAALTPEFTSRLEVTAPNHGELLVEWLNELLYRLEVKGEVHAWPGAIELGEGRLRCESAYLPLERCAGSLSGEIKSATYHALRFEPEGDGWVAEITLDT